MKMLQISLQYNKKLCTQHLNHPDFSTEKQFYIYIAIYKISWTKRHGPLQKCAFCLYYFKYKRKKKNVNPKRMSFVRYICWGTLRTSGATGSIIKSWGAQRTVWDTPQNDKKMNWKKKSQGNAEQWNGLTASI